jgi:hypothetical protein
MSWLLKAATDKLKELEESIDEAVGNTPIKATNPEPTHQTTTTTPTISSTSKPSTTKDDGWSAW